MELFWGTLVWNSTLLNLKCHSFPYSLKSSLLASFRFLVSLDFHGVDGVEAAYRNLQTATATALSMAARQKWYMCLALLGADCSIDFVHSFHCIAKAVLQKIFFTISVVNNSVVCKYRRQLQ